MNNIPPSLDAALNIAGALASPAVYVARETHRKIRKSMRKRRGLTLRPGVDTPLWNTVVVMVRSSLVRYGEKARLARYLGLPRQRVDDFLNGTTTMPDAERTLLLLQWLAAKKQGKELA